MGLSDLFKPKAMISVVLSKETQDGMKDKQFSQFESRLDKLGYKLQKLKKYSEKVFECNNQSTLAEIEECYKQYKKEKCRAKKEKASKTKVCPKRNQVNKCTTDDESMDIDDFSCGDQLQLSEESVNNQEGDKEDACEESIDCNEEDECEKEGEEDTCGIKKNKNGDAKDDKCTQVMTALEPKGSTYLVSQLEFEKRCASKSVTLSPSFSTSKATLNAEKNACKLVKRELSKSKTAKNYSTQKITNPSVRSLLKGSKSTLKASSHGLSKGEVQGCLMPDQDSLTKPALQMYTVQSSSRIENTKSYDKMSNISSKGQIPSRAISRIEFVPLDKKDHPSSELGSRTSQNSRLSKVKQNSSNQDEFNKIGSNNSEQATTSNTSYLSGKKVQLSSESGSKTTQNSRQSKLNEEESLNPDELDLDGSANDSQQTGSNSSNLYPDNKQQSIVYIVHSSQKRNLSNLPSEGTIHIDTSKVFIQNGTSTGVITASNISKSDHKPVVLEAQKSSEGEIVWTEITASPSDKLDSMSFQQSSNEFKSNENNPSIPLCKILVDSSGASTKALYNNSSKMISNMTGGTVQSLNVSKASGCSRKKSSQVQFVSNCGVMNPSSEQFVSESGLMKPSQNQFVSDCGLMKPSQNQFVSDCGLMKPSQNQFVSDCGSMKPSQNQFVSDCGLMKPSQNQFVSDCGLMKPSQNQFVSDCEVFYSTSGKKLLARRLSSNLKTSSQNKESERALIGKGKLGSSKNVMYSSNQNSVFNAMVSSPSEGGKSSIPVQSEQLSETGLNNNYTSNVSPASSGHSSLCQVSMVLLDSKENSVNHTGSSPTDIMSQLEQEDEAEGKSMEKESFNVLSNISGPKENTNSQQISPQISVRINNNEVEQLSRQSKSSNNENDLLEHTNNSEGSVKAVGSQEVSETSQQNETIAMFVEASMGLPQNRSKDYLLVHCNKCKEVCIAKILEKKQPIPDNWI